MRNRNISKKELFDLLASSDEATAKHILENISNNPDRQQVFSEVLGDLIEERFGPEDVSDSVSLNKYLQTIKNKDYKNFDDIRKLLYPGAKDVTASYDRSIFGSGSYYTNPMLDVPIRLGGTQTEKRLYDSALAKAVLSHEFTHSFDAAAKFLKRLQELNPEKAAQLVERIGNLGEGGIKFLEHVKNIETLYTPPDADMLNPKKTSLLKELFEKELPSQSKKEHLDLINKYDNLVKSGTKAAKSEAKSLVEYGGVPVEKLKLLPAEGIDFEPDRKVVKQVLEKHMSPNEAEIVRSTAHHLPRLDIPRDVGFQELRNILRIPKNKSMLGLAGSLLGKGLVAGATGLASVAAEAADSEEEGSSAEQNAFLRESDQRKFIDKIMKKIPEQNKQAVQEELDNQSLGIGSSVPKLTRLQNLLNRR